MKLKFVIDKELDWEYIEGLGGTLTYQQLDRSYEALKTALPWTLKSYQEVWDEINDRFSDYIENITGYKWFQDEYQCLLSIYFHGNTNWGRSNQISRCWWENPYYSRRITAHEMILSQYFFIYRNHYTNEGLTDGQVWALAEIAAFALTTLTEDIKDFWGWDTDYNVCNYPQIVELQNDLKDVFLNMKSFDDYMKAGFALVRKYPDMKP